MSIYTPQNPREILLKFAPGVYTPYNKSSTRLDFSAFIGNLSASLTSTRPYWGEAYTYSRGCPTYVVGYNSGTVQIIKGRCLYSGIRDLRGFIKGLAEATLDLSAYLNPTLKTDNSDLPTYCFGIGPEDLNAFIETHIYGGISANIGGHFPVDLAALIRSGKTDVSSLASFLHSYDQSYLGAVFSGTHHPVNLNTSIRSWKPSIGDLSAFLVSYEQRYLGAVFSGTHYPINLESFLRVNLRDSSDIVSSIRGFAYVNLSAFSNVVYTHSLRATLNPIGPENLSAYLKARFYSNLSSSVYSWQTLDLGACIKQVYCVSIPAILSGRDDMYKDLLIRLKGVAVSVTSDLSVFIRSMWFRDLSSSLRAIHLSNLGVCIGIIRPVALSGSLHSWDIKNLSGVLIGQDYPWNLPAIINSTGAWHTLSANIRPKTATAIYTSLVARIHPWEFRYLSSSITGDNAQNLLASLVPLGYSSSLTAQIMPKMIRLTTMINIPTLNSSNISATINYPCFYTRWSDLGANIHCTFKSDLFAYVRAVRPNYGVSSLPAKIGYHNFNNSVDKLKLRINIQPNDTFFEDKIKLYFNILTAGNLLNAYINGTLRYSQLQASVVATEIPKYKYSDFIKNREIVVHKEYDGVLSSIEYVELSFKSIVKDYYYSSEGSFVWKKDRFEKWMLNVKSYLPTNTALRLKRRLHRATTLYDLRNFVSVDEAMRYAIAFVTEYPKNDLNARISGLGYYSVLGGTLNARYVKNSKVGLSASIVPESKTFVLGFEGKIRKI